MAQVRKVRDDIKERVKESVDVVVEGDEPAAAAEVEVAGVVPSGSGSDTRQEAPA